MANKLNKLDELTRRLTKDLDDDISQNRTFCIVTYSALGLVALFMTIVNIITKKGFLTLATGLFAALCVVNIVLALGGDTAERIAKVLFAVEVIAMFSFFLVSGNPEGFSAIWICMLPSIGMFFFNRFRGTVICLCMFLIMIFFFWTPYGQSLLLFQYNQVFRMRFPILFVAFHLLAFLLETLRVNAFREMHNLQHHYQELSIRDQLTKMYNRQGMYGYLESHPRFGGAERIGVLMFDIDHFKDVNDTYGHNVGDAVLIRFAKIIKTNLNATVCRWGGEEFVAVYANDDIYPEQLSEVKDLIQKETFYDKDKSFNITASIGVASAYNFDVKKIDALIDMADKALYEAKNSGRNQIVYYRDIVPPNE